MVKYTQSIFWVYLIILCGWRLKVKSPTVSNYTLYRGLILQKMRLKNFAKNKIGFDQLINYILY